MTLSRPLEAPQLPAQVKQVLDDFLQAARESFGKDLFSVVLYGSAAEGKLRATSDVNLVLVLASFESGKADPLRAPLRVAQAAIQLRPMFLLKEEIPAAARSFASKFADILRRRASYVSRSLREEQLNLVVVSAIGPLRSSAAALLELQGTAAASSQQAFEHIGSDLALANWPQTLASLSAIQESRLVAPGEAPILFF